MRPDENLQRDYHSRDVCLFVGAGISRGCGLPDWEELASGVVDLFPRKPGPPLGARARAVRQGLPAPVDPNANMYLKGEALKKLDPLLSMRYARSDPDYDLRSLVARRLYLNSIELSDAVLEIPLLEQVRRICCYNYDDVLDRAFAEREKAYQPVFEGSRMELESEKTLVFYPHGFLPDPTRQSHAATDTIVLSEDDYFNLYRDPYAWANIVQLTLLLNYAGLFIGCSLRDPNLRRLLGIVKALRSDHRHYAVFPDFLDDDAPWFAQNAVQASRSVQSRLLDGLGVVTVWIREYGDLARKLQWLRDESPTPHS